MGKYKRKWKPLILLHPERPLPFYVREKQHLTSDEMCEFVAQECDDELDLAEFAQKLLDLFPNYDAKYLRGKCIEASNKYNKGKTAYAKEADIPPQQLEEFKQFKPFK